jgi:hypothetical protein
MEKKFKRTTVNRHAYANGPVHIGTWWCIRTAEFMCVICV